jgi:DnaJ-class molecular chaperone
MKAQKTAKKDKGSSWKLALMTPKRGNRAKKGYGHPHRRYDSGPTVCTRCNGDGSYIVSGILRMCPRCAGGSRK